MRPPTCVTFLEQVTVYFRQVVFRHQSFADALLVGYDNDASKQGRQGGEGFRNPGQYFQFVEVFYVVVVALFVDDAVAVQKSVHVRSMYGNRPISYCAQR